MKDPGDARQLLVQCRGVPHEPALAQLLSMIGGDDENGFVSESQLSQLAAQPAERLVDVCDRRIVPVNDVREFVGGQRLLFRTQDVEQGPDVEVSLAAAAFEAFEEDSGRVVVVNRVGV